VVILDREHDGLLLGDRDQPRGERVVQPAPERLGLQRPEILGGRFHVEEPTEERELAAPLLAERVGELPAGLLRLVVGPDPGQRSEQLGVRPVREPGAVRETACLEPALPGRLLARTDCGGEARLADAGLAGDGDERSSPARERLERGLDLAELPLAPDQRKPLRSCGRVLPRRPRAHEPPRDDRLELPFQRQLAHRLELEVVAGEAVREIADVRLAARRRRLQSLGEDHRIAEDGVVHPNGAPHHACDRVAGVDADVEREVVAPRAEVAADALELSLHLEGDVQRPLGVVLVTDRRAEERQERIAREFLDVALVATDDVREGRDERIDHLEQLLGIELVREGREAGDVREQRRDQPSLLGDGASRLDEPLRDLAGDEATQRLADVVRRRRRLGRLATRLGEASAVAAKARSGGILARAEVARPPGSDGRAAVAAEPHPGEDRLLARHARRRHGRRLRQQRDRGVVRPSGISLGYSKNWPCSSTSSSSTSSPATASGGWSSLSSSTSTSNQCSRSDPIGPPRSSPTRRPARSHSSTGG
jgi:hypothetical protein